MRWKAPTRGSERIIKRFAILPITINNETRWLEWCYIKQIYRTYLYTNDEWENIAFVTEDDHYTFVDSLYNS